MDHFSDYCAAVCRQVRYPFARGGITAELTAHLEDRAAALTQTGSNPDEAARLAVAAMGDPVETGRALNRVHPPVLSFSVALSKVLTWALGGVLLLLLVPLLIFAGRNLLRPADFHLPDGVEVQRAVRPNALHWSGNTLVWVTDVIQSTDGRLLVVTRNIHFGLSPGENRVLGPTLLDSQGEEYWGGSYSSMGSHVSYMAMQFDGYPLNDPAITLRFDGELNPGRLVIPFGEVDRP